MSAQEVHCNTEWAITSANHAKALITAESGKFEAGREDREQTCPFSPLFLSFNCSMQFRALEQI